MQQSGIKNITLYSADDSVISFNDAKTFSGITGSNIEIINEYRPNNTFTCSFTDALKARRELTFLLPLSLYSYIQDISDNVKGWYILIEYYNGDKHLFNTTHHFSSAEMVVGGYSVVMTSDTNSADFLTYSESGIVELEAQLNLIGYQVIDGFIEIYVQALDNLNQPVNSLSLSNFSTSSGGFYTSFNTYENGVYLLYLIGTTNTTVSFDYLTLHADLLFNADSIFYSSFAQMRHISTILDYVPYPLCIIDIHTYNANSEPSFGKWKVDVFGQYFTQETNDLFFEPGEQYRFTISLTIGGSGYIQFSYDTETFQVDESGVLTFDFTATSVLTFMLRYQYYGGNLNAMIDYIKITKL